MFKMLVLIPYKSGSVSDEWASLMGKLAVVLIPYKSGSVSDTNPSYI